MDDLERQVDAVFAQKRKVFCGDCFYYGQARERLGNGTTYFPVCRHPHAVQIEETWEGKRTVYVPPEERNAHNDCGDWKRRTWWQRLFANDFSVMMLVFTFFLVALMIAKVLSK